jgi:hypothetical protein
MMTRAGDYSEIRRYLLGGLDEEARQGIERRLLAEEEFFEELLFVEEELADQYLKEELSAEERRAFEGHFLSTPERRRKLSFARALGRYVSENSKDARAEVSENQTRAAAVLLPDAPTRGERVLAFLTGRGRGLRAATAFAALVLIAGAVWFAREPAPRTFVTITLSPAAATRGAGDPATPVRLTPDADALRVVLTLPVSSRASSFSVELKDERGVGERFEAERQDAQRVSVLIPSSRLRRGLYTLTVFETGADGAGRLPGNYLFNVE